MAEKKKMMKPRVTNREWLALHKGEYDKMVKSLGYIDPTPQQKADVISYLRGNVK